MGKKLTNEEFIQRIKNVNPNIEIVDNYINAKTKIKCRCLKCNYVWTAFPDNLYRGHGCPKCIGNIKKTTEQYKQELKDKNIQVECLGEYINNHTNILHRCLIHNVVWMISPYHILSGQGCYQCKIDKLKLKSKDELLYKQQLNKYNPTISLVGKYIGTHNKILHKCNVCGYEWNVVPASLISPKGGKVSSCPNCQISKLANRIKYYLDINNILYSQEYTFKDCKYKGTLRFDFAIFKNNELFYLIEADGIQHFQPVKFRNESKKQSKQNFQKYIKILL